MFEDMLGKIGKRRRRRELEQILNVNSLQQTLCKEVKVKCTLAKSGEEQEKE